MINGRIVKVSLASPKQKLANNTPEIEICNHQHDLLIDHCYIQKIVRRLCLLKGVKTDKVILHFVDSPKICELHEQVFGDSSFTDCITCPVDPHDQELPYHVLGECFICPLAAKESAPQSPHNELLLYVVHCFLHLLGYKDQTVGDRKIMQAEEQRLLKELA